MSDVEGSVMWTSAKHVFTRLNVFYGVNAIFSTFEKNAVLATTVNLSFLFQFHKRAFKISG